MPMLHAVSSHDLWLFESHLLQDDKAFLTQARPKQALHDTSIYLQNMGKCAFHYFDREGLLRQVALLIFGKSQHTPLQFILWKVCLLAAVLAAFITNDATSLVLSPLMLVKQILLCALLQVHSE